MQYSLDLQNVPKDANRHLRGFSEGNKILEMKLKQFRPVLHFQVFRHL